ncbi:hypothetical protein C8Q76DRAFT_417147 [Earliella scabrosa]|nr:hypothetical protein C8Q76DRAFT_417147 [Earliella scabrosa]
MSDLACLYDLTWAALAGIGLGPFCRNVHICHATYQLRVCPPSPSTNVKRSTLSVHFTAPYSNLHNSQLSSTLSPILHSFYRRLRLQDSVLVFISSLSSHIVRCASCIFVLIIDIALVVLSQSLTLSLSPLISSHPKTSLALDLGQSWTQYWYLPTRTVLQLHLHLCYVLIYIPPACATLVLSNCLRLSRLTLYSSTCSDVPPSLEPLEA